MTARHASFLLAAGAVVLLAACSAPPAETTLPEDTPTLVRTPPTVVPTPGPAQPTATHVPSPEDRDTGALRGEAHYQLGNPDAAIADFRKTLELQPAQADAAPARERFAQLAPGS